ncbi:UNVERIFIED_CONTAM: hypothetical protein FKN15_058696 [Acipenser sinensis]
MEWAPLKKGSRKTTHVTQTPSDVPNGDNELYPGCGERTPAADVPEFKHNIHTFHTTCM